MKIDLVVRGGMVADGTGGPLRRADVAISGDRIVAVGEVPPADAAELSAAGAVVAPGFINVLSHAYGTLQQDPRGLSDLYQGVTTEVFGEGFSLGPVSGAMGKVIDADPQAPGVRMNWPRLNDFLDHMATTGVGPNIASFVGAHNLRMIHAGAEDRALSKDELASACQILDDELTGGALGVASALIYSPGSYASTAELTAYAHVLAKHDALYISHVRNEADRLLDAVEELIEIARVTSARAEVYHLKASGRQNWPAMTKAIEKIQQARDAGLSISADIYPYEAGATTLGACIPPQLHEGGRVELLARLSDPETRAVIKAAIAHPGADWENLYLGSGGASGILLLGGIEPDVSGLTLAQVAAVRGDTDPIDTLLDLVSADPDLLAAYFEMTEENIHLALQSTWVSICSDSEAMAAQPPFTENPTHPRAYGAFARILGPYVRGGILTLEDAVRRMTSLPAQNLRLLDRGQIRVGAFADLVVFEPDEVADLATYRQPHRYAAGMRHVLINGTIAFQDGQPTGRLAGRALRRGTSQGE